jgi:hypothetical protein
LAAAQRAGSEQGAGDDACGDGGDGVDAHEGALELEQFREARQGLQLVALLPAPDLPGADAGLARPGAQNMHPLPRGAGRGGAVDLDLASGQVAAPVGEDVEQGPGAGAR